LSTDSKPKNAAMAVGSRRQFFVLAIFLVFVFLTGGSSKAEVATLAYLRPISVLLAGYAIATLQLRQLHGHRAPFAILIACIVLTALHLVPLPPSIWQSLPGRAIIADVDRLIGAEGVWRPLSMVPLGTLNALYSLAVPVGVFCLAVQLDSNDQKGVLILLICLTLVSGMLGLLQAAGSDYTVYARSSENPGLFANRNHQGALLAMLFPMLAALVTSGAKLPFSARATAIFAAALAIFAVPLIIVTGSRAGMFLAAAAVALTIVFWRDRGRNLPMRQVAVGLFAVLAMAAVTALTIYFSRDTAIDRLDNAGDSIRFPVWASIVDVLPRYMPWGTGIGSYVEAYQVLEPSEILRPKFSNHAHNEWLEIALTAGIPGLLILAAAGIYLIRVTWKALTSSGTDASLQRLGATILIVLAFASTLDYPVRTPILAAILMIASVWASPIRKLGNASTKG
jgi:O-antigen ligase